MEFADVVSRLRFLGKIKSNEKLDVNVLRLRSNNAYTRLQRTYRSYVLQDEKSCRTATLDYITATFDKAFELLISVSNTETYKFPLLVNGVRDAITGVEQLRETYADDRMFVARLQTLIDVSTAKLNALQEASA
jgi:hypothetical protein